MEGRNPAFRGQDIEAELQLTLREAAVTHKQTFTVGGETLRITVPAGVANGQVIKLKGHGGKGANGGPDGDLYISFVISDDPVFKRKENDLYTNVTIDLYTAVLGGEVTVNTLDGQVKLKVRPGTQNDAMVRLKGKGFPVLTCSANCKKKRDVYVETQKLKDYANRFDYHKRLLYPV